MHQTTCGFQQGWRRGWLGQGPSLGGLIKHLLAGLSGLLSSYRGTMMKASTALSLNITLSRNQPHWDSECLVPCDGW